MEIALCTDMFFLHMHDLVDKYCILCWSHGVISFVEANRVGQESLNKTQVYLRKKKVFNFGVNVSSCSSLIKSFKMIWQRFGKDFEGFEHSTTRPLQSKTTKHAVIQKYKNLQNSWYLAERNKINNTILVH